MTYLDQSRFHSEDVGLLTDDEVIALFRGPPTEADYAATVALIRELFARGLDA